MRAFRIVAVRLRASILLALQYRVDFLVDVLLEVVAVSSAIIPLWVVFSDRRAVAGVSFEEALVVAGVFTILQGVVEAAVVPSLTSVVEHVRSGTLDFVLLLPADAQLLVSTSRFLPWRFVNVITGAGIVIAGMTRLGAPILPGRMLVAALLFTCGLVILYAIVLVAVTASFFATRVDNLAYLMTSLVDAGRWPVRVFRGLLRWMFTFVFPLAVMTSFPAEAILGRMTLSYAVMAVALAIAFSVAARAFFRFSLRRYASASS